MHLLGARRCCFTGNTSYPDHVHLVIRPRLPVHPAHQVSRCSEAHEAHVKDPICSGFRRRRRLSDFNIPLVSGVDDRSGSRRLGMGFIKLEYASHF